MSIDPQDDTRRWIHLLNVSHLMPNGQSGFRGMNRPPAEGAPGRMAPIVPARNVLLTLPGRRPKSARLAIAGEELSLDPEGRILVPKVGLHDAVVVELE